MTGRQAHDGTKSPSLEVAADHVQRGKKPSAEAVEVVVIPVGEQWPLDSISFDRPNLESARHGEQHSQPVDLGAHGVNEKATKTHCHHLRILGSVSFGGDWLSRE